MLERIRLREQQPEDLAPLPSLADCMAANLAAARLTNPAAQFIGIAINSARMEEGAARQYMTQTEAELGLPVVDPVRDGVARLIDRLP